MCLFNSVSTNVSGRDYSELQRCCRMFSEGGAIPECGEFYMLCPAKNGGSYVSKGKSH